MTEKHLEKVQTLMQIQKWHYLLLFYEVQGIEARSAPRPQMDSETKC